MRALIWFRQDLRLADHPALQAVLNAECVLPVYIWDTQTDWALGGAAQVYLHQSLAALDQSLQALGSALFLSQGPALQQLQALIEAYEIDTVVWNRVYEPALIARDTEIKRVLKAAQIQVKSFNGALLFEPWQIESKTGTPYKVFTPFWRRCQEYPIPEPWPMPTALPPLPASVKAQSSLALDALKLLPEINWHEGIVSNWEAGEQAAQNSLDDFLATTLEAYQEARNIPSQRGTSRLSPHLRFGEISPRQVWQAAHHCRSSEGRRVYLSEIGWREFAYHVLYHFPHTPTAPLNEKYQAFPWQDAPDMLRAWQKGLTGFPIVDAGMRELWHMGWMHNRVRMIVASFLTKDLRISWLEGARWFWDTLVDADLASNTLGWQWAGGCGADAAPYFRVFNPMTQSEKFDPQGLYLREWLPELASLPNKWIHNPSGAPPEVLAKAGVELGRDYPRALVDHKAARLAALAAFESVKK